MRIRNLILAGGVLGWSITATAMAQDVPSQTARTTAVQATAFEYDEYLGPVAQNTADARQTEAAEPASGTTSDAMVYDSGTYERPCRTCRNGSLGDPWTLPQANFLKERNIVVSGWLEGGIYGNQYGNALNGPIGMRRFGDGFNADQLWLSVDKQTDTKGHGWDVGGHVDYVFGDDGPLTQSFGDRTWDYGWNSSSRYGSAMPQLYGEIAYNNLKVKAGHFYTPIGYEVVQAPMNFFYSHSYSHTYGEPFTHTGALASYAANEKVTFCGGWTNGWDEGWQGADNGSTFLGGIAFTFSEKTSLAWYLSAGKIGDGTAFPGAASGNIYYNSVVFSHKLSDRLTYVFEHDLGTNYDVVGAADNQWYELNNYLLFKLNDCWALGTRLEWFQDPQGARVNPGSLGNYYSASVGVNYKPHANVTVRPELRYDWFDGFAGASTLPFNDGTKSSQLCGGLDFIFTF